MILSGVVTTLYSTGGQLENFEDFSPVSFFSGRNALYGTGTKVIELFLAFWTLTVVPPDFFEV